MQTIFKVTILCSLTMLAACQTSGTNDAAVDPKEADLVRNLTDETCVVTSSNASNPRQRKADVARITVLSIRDRHDSWRAADVAFKGFRDNIYFNKSTAQMICGGKNWNAFKGGRYEPSNSKILSELPGYKMAANAKERSIAVSWEGYAELFSGTIREINNGASGTVALVLPNNEGNCTGGYNAKSRTEGDWNIACTNGLSAKGTYTAFGKGKGASGTGIDKEGRKVTYTMGGQT